MTNRVVIKLRWFYAFLWILYISYGSAYGQASFVSLQSETSGTGGRISYTVGQSFAIHASGSQGTTISGIQQPFHSYTISIAEESVKVDVTVYPNPVTGILVLNTEATKPGIMSYELYDANGSLLRFNNFNSSETLIDMSEMQAALYILKVIDSGRVIKSFKILKN